MQENHPVNAPDERHTPAFVCPRCLQFVLLFCTFPGRLFDRHGSWPYPKFLHSGNHPLNKVQNKGIGKRKRLLQISENYDLNHSFWNSKCPPGLIAVCGQEKCRFDRLLLQVSYSLNGESK